MKLPKIVIMDLGNTIIKNNSISFEQGFKYLYDNYCQHQVDFTSFLSDINNIHDFYKKRDNDDFEIPFINYLRYVDSTIGFKHKYNYHYLERIFIKQAFNEELMPYVEEFLVKCKKHHIDIYILSNSTFSKHGLISELKAFNLNHYFKEIYSSADYLGRKPNQLFFKALINKLIRKHPLLNKKDIWYIGNDFHYDVEPAIKYGLTTIWMNESHLPNEKQLPCINIDSYQALIEVLDNEDL